MATEKVTKKKDSKKEAPALVKEAVVLTPRVTEKAAHTQKSNGYVFGVPVNATKSEIAKAFEKKYKQKPVKVNLINEQRKSVYRRGVLGFGTKQKKAYIFVKKGVTIEVM